MTSPSRDARHRGAAVVAGGGEAADRRREVGEHGVEVAFAESLVRLPQRLLGHRRVRIRHVTSIACTLRDLDETLLRQLYATPPPEFVAARNELVKALRRDKRRDEATAVAALRRPGWDDWALNAVAASDADVVAGFADAAADVRAAQAAAIEGRDGPDIRVALRDLRRPQRRAGAWSRGRAGRSRPRAGRR